jgi:acyl carrier protein
LSREYVAPRTPTETALADIWREVLRVDRVGVHDGFFELGGHSLLAMQLVSHVRAAVGVTLPVRVIFMGPTVAELAVRIEEALASEIEAMTSEEVKIALEHLDGVDEHSEASTAAIGSMG